LIVKRFTRVLIAAVSLLPGALAVAPLATANDSNCALTSSGSHNPATPNTGGASKSALVPTPESQALKWEFDGDRNETYWDIVLQASPPLAGIDPAEIDVTPGRMAREDNHTAFRRPLTFTPPKISSNGKRVTFRICADPHGIEAGTYKATVNVDGPGTITGVSLDVSVTARDAIWFVWSLAIVAVVVALGIELKSVADYQRAIRGTKTSAGKATPFNWRDALLYIWRLQDLRFASTLVGIGSAFITVAVLYNKDHTWGEDVFKSVFAAAQAAIVAVGAQGVLDGLRGAGQEAGKRGP
jgi:hypothetical protein